MVRLNLFPPFKKPIRCVSGSEVNWTPTSALSYLNLHHRNEQDSSYHRLRCGRFGCHRRSGSSRCELTKFRQCKLTSLKIHSCFLFHYSRAITDLSTIRRLYPYSIRHSRHTLHTSFNAVTIPSTRWPRPSSVRVPVRSSTNPSQTRTLSRIWWTSRRRSKPQTTTSVSLSPALRCPTTETPSPSRRPPSCLFSTLWLRRLPSALPPKLFWFQESLMLSARFSS